MQKDPITLIYKLRELGFSLWLEGNKINYRSSRENDNFDKHLQILKANKEAIVSVLEKHECFSEEAFHKYSIFHDNLNKGPVSFSQERLYFINKYEEGTAAYNLSFFFQTKSDRVFSLEAFKESIRQIILRHKILRTFLREDLEGNIFQIISEEIDAHLTFDVFFIGSEEEVESHFRRAVQHIFSLPNEYPIRTSIFYCNEKIYIGFVFHHVAFDGWSIDLFLSELEILYLHYTVGIPLNLPTLSIQYKDFAIWQRNNFGEQFLEEQIRYWEQALEEYKAIDLPRDKPRPLHFDYKGKNLFFSLDFKESKLIRQLARDLKVSLFSVLISAYYLMLRIYSNSDDLIIGTPFANRHYAQVDHLIGFFVNTLPLRIKMNSSLLISEFIHQVNSHVIQSQLNQDVPFELLVDRLKVEKNSSQHPLFQILFDIQNFGINSDGEFLKKVEAKIDSSDFARFDLSLSINEGEEEIKGVFNYATSLFEESTVLGFKNTYILILKQFSNLLSDEKKVGSLIVSDIKYVDEKTLNKLGQGLSSSNISYPSFKTISQLFEDQVALSPSKTAVIYRGYSLSYRELNEKSNQLAHYIRKKQSIKRDAIIALCLEKNEFLLIGILGVLKAGASYLPLDPTYPSDRIDSLIEDSQAILLLTNQKREGQKVSEIDLLSEAEEIKNCSAENLTFEQNPSQLCYVIYTSGSTGKPKGVMVEHKAFVGTIWGIKGTFFSSHSPISTYSLTNYGFDIFGLEYAIPLLTGGSITLGVETIFDQLDCSTYQFIQMTPSLCEINLEKLKNTEGLKLFIGGEPLSQKLLKRILEMGIECINLYGPTETTIWSTSMPYFQNTQETDVRIGRPFPNEKVYVLSEDLRLKPSYAVGELFIGGVGLARGYLNDFALTQEKFIQNPFENGLIYKTGDLVRWLPDGALEYIGRKDFQVKIRGQRVELGEIESCICQYPGVSQAIVTVKDGALISQLSKESHGQVGLIAYYQTEDGWAIEEEKIEHYLKLKLPSYMIPIAYLHLAKWPLTSTGKIDRKKLPEPQMIKRKEFIGPRDSIEKQIQKIWGAVIGIPEETIDIRDDFFKLGGNSLLAIKLISNVNREFNLDLKLRELFVASSLINFYDLIKNHNSRFIYSDFLISESDQIELFNPFPLSNVQQAYNLGRLNDLELGNTSAHIYVEYKFTDLDIDRLEISFNLLLDRHLALKTVIKNGFQEFLKEKKRYKINLISCSNEEEFLKIRYSLSHKIYNSEIFPLFDILVSQYRDYFVLHISIDGLLMDAESIRILFSEWTLLYRDTNAFLEKLDITYRDYMIQTQKIKQSRFYLEAKEYWDKKLTCYDFDIRLPLETDPSLIIQPKFVRISKRIPKAVWQLLLAKGRSYGISPTALILDIFGKVLCRWSGQNKICINLTLFNRLPLHPQIDKIVGDFTSLELFGFEDLPNAPIKERVKRVHQSLLMDIENNIFDGVDCQRLMRQKQGLSTQQIIAPVVLTSVLGQNKEEKENSFLDTSFQGEFYSITQTSQVWLDNKAYDEEGEFVAEWDYVEDLFNKQTIKAMHDSYCSLIEKIAFLNWESDPLPHPNIETKDLELIKACNQDKTCLSEDTLFSRYEKVIESEKYHHETAIYDDRLKRSYSYGELLLQTKVFSSFIQESGTEGELIAVLCEKGYLQVAAVISIMKGGYGYLPLNIEWPLERFEEILEQGGVSTIFISAAQYNKKRIGPSLEENYQVFILEEIESELVERYSSNPLSHLPIVKPDDVAYVIFTSGSSGKPKGVTISHRGALNTIDAVNKRFEVNRMDSVLALSDLSFDLSVYDLFGMLAVGGKIIMPDQEKIQDPLYWEELIFKHRITIWNTVPQLAVLLLEETRRSFLDLSSIRLWLLSGDWVPIHLPEIIRKRSSSSEVVSLGGATEGSIWSIWYKTSPAEKFEKSIPYGIPMPNQQVWVLDDNYEHCPVGVIGEIFIGGLGVALNYYKASEATNNAFFNHSKLGRIYKTGDFGKWNRKGYIEFAGRKDRQVKINGYRVELGEISSQLLKIPGIKDVYIQVIKERNKNSLISYVIPDREIDVKENKEQFILNQKGIDNSLNIKYKFELKLIEKEYRKRKSYRNFEKSDIDVAKVLTICNSNLVHLADCKVKSKDSFLREEIISEILSEISGLTLNDKVLPKYKYPSAGGTYSIRTYLNLPKPIGSIMEGFYYYHPLLHGLCQANKFDQASNFKTVEIFFTGFWPGIEPFYGDFSRKLAFLELGHIIYLVKKILEGYSIRYRIEILDEEIDFSNTLLAKATIGMEEGDEFERNKFFDLSNNFILNVLRNERSDYLPIQGSLHYSTKSNSVFFQTTETQKVLEAGKILLCLEGDENPKNWVFAGALFQAISTDLYKENIGSCMVGLDFSRSVLYSAVLGGINENEKNKGVSNCQGQKLKDIINKELGNVLPSYMVPQEYLVLEKFPLTPNGKVDINQLPKPLFREESRIIHPRTPLEEQMRGIWAEVLGFRPIDLSIKSEFFQLGGDSIKSIQLITRVRDRLGIQIPLKKLFLFNTIEKLMDQIDPAFLKANIKDLSNLLEQEVGKVFLANSLQQGFIFHYLKRQRKSRCYHVQLFWQYHQEIDLNNYMQAWDCLVQTFGAFKTIFSWENGEIIQIIQDEISIDFKFIDLSILGNENQIKTEIYRLRDEDYNRPFILDEGPLFRVKLLKEGDRLFGCLFSHHHAILDGWSNSILLQFLHRTYLEISKKKEIEITPSKSYEKAQKYLELHSKDHLDFWNLYLAKVEDKKTISSLCQPGEDLFAEIQSKVEMRVFGQAYFKLKEKLNLHGLTMNAFLHFCWHLVLYIFTGKKRTVVGTIFSMRNLPIEDIENGVGLLINTLPFFVDHDFLRKESIIDAVRSIQKELIEVGDKNSINLKDIQKKGEELFDNLFLFANYPSFDPSQMNEELRASFEETIINEDYPLVLTVFEENEQLRLVCKYNEKLIKNGLICYLVNKLVFFVNNLELSYKKLVSSISYLDDLEYDKIICQWNQTKHPLTNQYCLLNLFEEQVALDPHKVALVYEETTLTYGELNEKANQIAHYLRKLGIRSDEIVGIGLERSFELIIAIYSVIKAGGAYLPLEISYPQHRLNYMLDDAKSKVIIILKKNAEQFSFFQGKLLFIDDFEMEESRENLFLDIPSTSLAYVIYTSGSTGEPKGVCVPHEGLYNRISWMQNEYSLSSDDSVLQKTPFSFDVSVWEFFWPLAYGASLVIAKPGIHRNNEKLIETIQKYRVTIAHFVPSMLSSFLEFEGGRECSSLKKVFSSGEILSSTVVKKFFNQSNAELHNLYGPTEACIDVTYFNCRNLNSYKEVPIGKPIWNMQAYILDEYLNPLPIGASGELYLSGIGLARGYLNKASLTKEKFVQLPFGLGIRAYKTGDLARYLPDGNIEFLGRLDHQVKIRGVRIELEEIEIALKEHPKVNRCCVVVLREKTKRENLIAYLVLSDFVSNEEFRKYLSKKIPEYMVPSHFVRLEEFPLTMSGKVDRNALKEMEVEEFSEHISPTTDVEKEVCKIWQEVLESDAPIGMKDHFLKLGGNSILALKLASMVNKAFSVKINVADIFSHLVVEDFINQLDVNNPSSFKGNKYEF